MYYNYDQAYYQQQQQQQAYMKYGNMQTKNPYRTQHYKSDFDILLNNVHRKLTDEIF